ncbi:hypothetical protein D4R71_05810 [bacterium]|nr:MAG: hypothetical protein D4R71_05810 [bacterium]
MSEKYKDYNIDYDNEYKIDNRNDPHSKKDLIAYHTHNGTAIWLTKEQIKLRQLRRKKKKKLKKIYIYTFW